MKKTTLSLIISITLIAGAGAQFNTNSKMVGASSSFNFGLFSEKDDVSGEKVSLRRFDLTPKAAYFIRNRIALGGELYIESYSQKYEGSDPYTTSSWRIGPFGRYYYKTVSWFVPFGEARTGYGRDVEPSFLGEGEKIKHNVFYAGLGVGASVFLAENFSLEAMLSYQYEKAKNPEGGGSHTTNGVVLGFGFVFYFNSLMQDTGGVR